MSLIVQITEDIKTAMKARAKDRLSALRAIKAALLLEATKEGAGDEISEEVEGKILLKLFKQRNDSAKIYVEQGREDLAQEEQVQADVIKEYLPAQMSEDDVRKVVEATIAKVGASGPQDIGKVMGPIMGQLNGKADGSLISKLVKEMLNS